MASRDTIGARKAADSNAVLFFDEADALFGTRSGDKDAEAPQPHPQLNGLRRRIDGHSGLVIMAATERPNLDDAFARRIRFVVEFR